MTNLPASRCWCAKMGARCLSASTAQGSCARLRGSMRRPIFGWLLAANSSPRCLSCCWCMMASCVTKKTLPTCSRISRRTGRRSRFALGLVVAKVSGKPFAQFLRERIFAPLGMTQTLAYEKGESEVSRRAYGHSKEGEAWKETDQSSTSATLGDGGIYSSLEDLAKWDEALAQHTL